MEGWREVRRRQFSQRKRSILASQPQDGLAMHDGETGGLELALRSVPGRRTFRWLGHVDAATWYCVQCLKCLLRLRRDQSLRGREKKFSSRFPSTKLL